MIGASKVGSVSSIGLTSNGEAGVKLALDPSAAPMREGTVARIYENSLSGIASKYVVLEPGPGSAAAIPSGGLIPPDHAYSPVGFDELFDTFDPLTRAGLQNVIQGGASSIRGRAADANRALQYLAPGLASAADVTTELARDAPAFDGLLAEGAKTMQALASKSGQLSDLIAHVNTTTAAIGRQSRALEQALALLPGTLRHSTSTFAGLQSTLSSLDPLVAASKPAVRRLVPFASGLRSLLKVATPTVGQLDLAISNPNGIGDLTSLARQTPSLARAAAAVFPRLLRSMNDSQQQLDYLRAYTPDIVAAIGNIGQAGAYYDANGHYLRGLPVFDAFGLNSANQLTMRFPSQRYEGFQVVHDRCPGGAVQPPPDRSAPQTVWGCNPSSTPAGP
jgi:phospholipid/cholesterol/gamma-HCH transport system substrate-binding protein